MSTQPEEINEREVKRRSQGLRCTSVQDAHASLRLMDATEFNVRVVTQTLTDCEYQGFQKTKVKMLRGWLTRATKRKAMP
jgi:hypothetical protein